jgi:hypothetical protein
VVRALHEAAASGWPPRQLLAAVVDLRELDTARSIAEVIAWRIDAYTTDRAAPQQLDRPTLLPWIGPALTPESASSNADRQITEYLRAAAHMISTRIRALTNHAVRTRPPWISAFGVGPDDPVQHQEWLRHIGIVAAYRDQYRVSYDDPRQILGPYAEPGHAGHGAYWHAAASVLAARSLASLEPTAGGGSRRPHTVADLYLALPDAERAAVNMAMAERLGTLWFGARREVDDFAATRPMYAPQLTAALAERGHVAQEPTLPSPHGDTQPAAEAPVEAALVRHRARRQVTEPDPRQKGTPYQPIRQPPARLHARQPLRHNRAEPSQRQPNPLPLPPQSQQDRPDGPRPAP